MLLAACMNDCIAVPEDAGSLGELKELVADVAEQFLGLHNNVLVLEFARARASADAAVLLLGQPLVGTAVEGARAALSRGVGRICTLCLLR